MSWLSKNYEKASLGGAVVIALGLAFWGYTKVNGVEEEFASAFKESGNNDPSVKDADKVTKAISSIKAPRALQAAEVGDRPVDLFTGVPLFISSKTNKPVYLPTEAPVHPPIPNSWWLEYRIDPGFADSPQRDEDRDGYSNLEEFEAKTDPADATKFPAVINKLRFVREEAVTWVLRPGFDADGGFPFTYTDLGTNAQNKIPMGGVVKPNEIFFAEGAVAKGRFKLLGSEVRPVLNPKTQSETPTTFVRVEDQKPNKKGKIYEIVAQFPDAQRANFRNYDRTAVLKLDALGKGSIEFKVEENTAFAVPADAPKKDYFLKSVTEGNIEVEYTDADGAKKTIQIPKN